MMSNKAPYFRNTKAFIATAMLASISVFAASPVIACSCVPPPPVNAKNTAERVQQSSAVFVGVVTQVNKNLDHGRLIQVQFRVKENFKAASSPRYTSQTENSSAACGATLIRGVTYLVFEDSMHGQQFLSSCGGVIELDQAFDYLKFLRAGRRPPSKAVTSAALTSTTKVFHVS